MPMLFIGVARHTAENCPAGNIKPNKDLGNKLSESVTKAGGKVTDVYLDAPGHTFYLVLEANSENQLWDATEPLRLIGDVQLTPVARFDEALTHARQTGLQK